MRREAGLTLFFSVEPANAGPCAIARPDVAAIASVAAASGEAVPFSISHRPKDHPYWVELLALGLTFDLRGLAPGVGAEVAVARHAFGLALDDVRGMEAMVLRTGPHLASADALLPVVRTMAALGCELAALPGLAGIGWEPAGTVMAPDYFRRTVRAWLDGGPFPGLGLTALARRPDGAMRSVGLAFFTGQELELSPAVGEGPADTARLAVRLIHDLVENGPYTGGDREGPGGEILHCSVSADRTLLKVRRDS